MHDMTGKSEGSYCFVRTAERDAVGKGMNMYVECPDCGEMVLLYPGECCCCNHVVINELPGGKCVCNGGREPVNLYRIVQETREEPVFVDVIPERKTRFRLRKMDIIAIVLFLIALLSILYAKVEVVGYSP